MAWPVVTDFFAAQVAFQAPSGLPTDVFSNTWYFRNRQEPSITPMGERIATVLEAFYTNDFTGSARSVVSYMPNSICQEVRLKVYDLGQGPPRNPDYELTWDWQSQGGTLFALPREVAVVLSYYAGRQELEPPINARRRRGRLFLGPFTTEGLEAQGTMVPNLRGVISLAAENVLNTTEDVEWSQLSTTDGALAEVTGGWVDDAWDTQRSRGYEPTSRVTFGAPLAT